jgi:hypothetical protein
METAAVASTNKGIGTGSESCNGSEVLHISKSKRKPQMKANGAAESQ